MTFDWGARKSIANKAKHGIDFRTAMALWLDDDRIEIEAPHPVEERRILVGRLQEKLWTAVFTIRGKSTIRIISVRRSRNKEVALYEKGKIG